MTNLYTPDRELNPPDDEVKYDGCTMCDASGLYRYYDNEFQCWMSEPCENCDGEGTIEIEDWHPNEEW